jgi:tRNA G18 (ribose-2'-O)-methylase SpoU
VSSPVALLDPDDPRLLDYRGLTDTVLRRRVEPAGGLFIAEGEWVVRRALASGHRLRSLLLADNRVEAVGDLVDVDDCPVYVAPLPVLEKLTGFHVHRGVLAAVHRRPELSLEELLAGFDGRPAPRRICVLEELSNPTNLGAVFRSAAGLGIDAVLLAPTCGDPLYRRSVRTSMGEVFALPYARVPDWPDGLSRLREAGFRLLALTPADDAVPLDELSQAIDTGDDARLALLLGAEGPGLTEQALTSADLRVRIPMAAGVDSLNVAAAAAVACWVIGRRAG